MYQLSRISRFGTIKFLLYCNIVQLILLADDRTFRKNIPIHKMHILFSNLDLKGGCQLCCTSLGMPYSVVITDQGCISITEMVQS